MMVAPMVTMAQTVDSIPSAIPERITVAGPVRGAGGGGADTPGLVPHSGVHAPAPRPPPPPPPPPAVGGVAHGAAATDASPPPPHGAPPPGPGPHRTGDG